MAAHRGRPLTDESPVLLRPRRALSEAMTVAAGEAGVSRQVWMLAALEEAVLRDSVGGSRVLYGEHVGPADVPLLDEKGDIA